MGFIETSYGSSPNLSQVNIDSNLNLGTYGITTNGELNINDSDLIGVNQFVCKDYLGGVRATASDVAQWDLNLGSIVGGIGRTLLFRVPSNFITSTIKISYVASGDSTSMTSGIQIYDPDTQTYSYVFTKNTAANTTETVTSSELTVHAGELYCLYKPSTTGSVDGSSTKILCDLSPVTGGYWEVGIIP